MSKDEVKNIIEKRARELAEGLGYVYRHGQMQDYMDFAEFVLGLVSDNQETLPKSQTISDEEINEEAKLYHDEVLERENVYAWEKRLDWAIVDFTAGYKACLQARLNNTAEKLIPTEAKTDKNSKQDEGD